MFLEHIPLYSILSYFHNVTKYDVNYIDPLAKDVVSSPIQVNHNSTIFNFEFGMFHTSGYSNPDALPPSISISISLT